MHPIDSVASLNPALTAQAIQRHTQPTADTRITSVEGAAGAASASASPLGNQTARPVTAPNKAEDAQTRQQQSRQEGDAGRNLDVTA